MVEATESRASDQQLIRQLRAKNKALTEQVQKLQDQLHAVLAMFQSGRSERRPLSGDPGQGQLFDLGTDDQATNLREDQSTPTGALKPKPPRKARAAKRQGVVTLPHHLERREETVEPDLDPEHEWELIGTERTELLEREPGRVYVRVILRPKYKKVTPKSSDEPTRIVGAPAIERVLPGSYVGAGFLAWMIVDKLVDHLPFYRQIKRLQRESGVQLPKSTVNDWFAGACTLLEPLYDRLRQQTLSADYLQADESRIEVLTTINQDKDGNTKQGKKKPKPGTVKIRRGWMWVVHDPQKGGVVFNFEPSRGKAAANTLLGDYTGYLQVDGYVGYEDLLQKKSVAYVACAAHIRRKFYAALKNDRKRAEKGMDYIAGMYALENQTEEMSAEARQEYRMEHLQPLLVEYKTWLLDQYREVTPKSNIGRAIKYALNRHEGMENMLIDGRLKLDNNLIENTIRPLALGRKNYLFAGSDAGAQRLAMMYSFFGTCKALGVNPLTWLHRVLEIMPTANMSDLDSLLPGNLNLEEG